MAEPKFVWPKKPEVVFEAHIVKDPYVHVGDKVGVETYCRLWFAWGEFWSHINDFGRCTACLKGFMADNVVVTDGSTD